MVVVVVFDCLPHSFLIGKLDVYGFDKTSTKYLKDHETFSSWTNILHEVPQGSILGQLVFNVFLSDLFLFKPNIDLVSYADGTTRFIIGGSSELEAINEIKCVAESLTFSFQNNCM